MKVKLIIDFLNKESYELVQELVEYRKHNELDLEIQGYDLNRTEEINNAYYGLYYSTRYGVALEYVNRVLKAHYDEAKNIAQLDVLASCYRDVGFNPNDLIDAIMEGDFIGMHQYLQKAISSEAIDNHCFAYIYDDEKELHIGKDAIINAITK